MSPYHNCIWLFFTLASCTLHLSKSWEPALEQASWRVIKPLMKLLNCLWRRKETFLWTSKSSKRIKFQVLLQEKSFTPRFIKDIYFYLVRAFSSHNFLQRKTYSLPGKQKMRLHSLQLLCNTTWKDVKMPGVILNTSKSF